MPTQLIRSLANVTQQLQGCVMTIGNFDGVHRGHQALLTKLKERAQATQRPSVLITFEPHPFEFFTQTNLTIPRITRFREKFSAIRQQGIDDILLINFNQQVASISASDFVEILYAKLQPSHLIIGDDFRFGYKRQGDFALLQQMGTALGFTVESMPSVLLEGERVSSTRVRQTLMAGDLKLAAQLLGRPYAMQGRVRYGDQLGRQLECPTANIYLHRRLTPVNGVFSVLVHGVAERPWPGAANVGTRPTVHGTTTLLEVHLLDFNRDIYGQYVEVEFCQKLRDEIRYPNLTLLKQQMLLDVEMTRDYFLKLGYL